jgi:hypothetical protein
MKAIKKPVTIDYHVWDGSIVNLGRFVAECGDTPEDFFIITMSNDYEYEVRVKTLEGVSYSVPKDYIIIRGIEGEYYPCSPLIFNATYDIIS